MSNEIKIKVLESKIRRAENRGFGTMGVVRRWKREIRNLKK